MIPKVIEGTILLIILYLVLANSKAFTSIIATGAGAYGSSVKILQGRG